MTQDHIYLANKVIDTRNDELYAPLTAIMTVISYEENGTATPAE